MPKITGVATKTVGDPLGRIAEQLRPLAVPVEKLIYDPDNARKHPEANMRALKTSLNQYGQVKPVVALKDMGVVLAGNGTLQAARELGWTHLAVVYVQMDETEARGFAIADNRTAELAEWDFQKLAESLRVLQDQLVDLEQHGWSAHHLEPLLQADWSPPAVQDDEFAHEHTVKFTFRGPPGKLVGMAVERWRDETGDNGLKPEECLEGLCRKYLTDSGVTLPGATDGAETAE